MLTRLLACAHYGCNALVRPTALLARPLSSSGPALVQRKVTKTKLKTHKGTAKRWFAIAGAFKRVSRASHPLLGSTGLRNAHTVESRQSSSRRGEIIETDQQVPLARLSALSLQDTDTAPHYRLGQPAYANPTQARLLRKLLPYHK